MRERSKSRCVFSGFRRGQWPWWWTGWGNPGWDVDEMWMRCWTFKGLVISSWFKLYSEKPNKTLASFILLKPPWSQKTAGFFDLIYCRWLFLHASTNALRRIWKEISPTRGEFSINLSIISALKSFSKMQVWQLPSILGKIVGYNIYVAAPRLISFKHRG